MTFALALLITPVPFHAQGPSPLQRMPFQLWETTIAEPDSEYEFKAGTVSQSNGSVWIALGVRPKGKLSGPQRVELQRFNGDGKRTDVMPWNGIPGSSQHVVTKLYGIAVDASDRVYLFVQTASAEVVMFRYDTSKKTATLFKKIDTVHRPISIAKILRVSNDEFLLLGHVDAQAIVVQVDSTGEIVREVLLVDDVSTLLDGVLHRDGTVFLAGAKVSETRAVSLWIASLSRNGGISRSLVAPGSRARLAPQSGGLVVLSNASSGSSAALVVAAYSTSLSLLWQRVVPASINDQVNIGLGALPDDQSLAVWEEKKHLALTILRKDGSSAFTATYEDPRWAWQQVWNVDVVSSGATTLLPVTMLIVDQKREQRQIVKIMSLGKQQ